MLLKMTDKIAYLITYISYNCVYNNRGTIEETLLEQFILDEVSEYIINNSCSTKFEHIDDVIKFWSRYGGYNVWDAYCVKNNNWINIKPTNEDILLNIYDMTKSIEILEENKLSNSLDDTLEILNISEISQSSSLSLTLSMSEMSIEKIFEEDVEIDWNKILNQEQEEYEKCEEYEE